MQPNIAFYRTLPATREDAWHPCTAEFWPTTHGRLIYTRCKACASESAQHARGIVTAEAA